MTRTRRILLWVLLPLLALLVLVPLAGVGLLLSDTGSRWVLERVPGLSLERYQGALLGRWQADRLQWESDETRVVLEQPLMELDAACLWRGMLCLEQLQVKRVTLELPDSTDEPDEPAADVELPDINLPVAVRIGQLEVGELLLNGEGLLSQLQLAASASGNELVVGNLSLVYDTYQAALDGRLQLNEQWPLEFTLDAGGELPELGQQQLSVRLDGALRDEVRLDGVLQGALTGTLQARLQPLRAALPASLELALQRLELGGLLPADMLVESVGLTAKGSLEQGFAWQLDSALQARQQTFVVAGHGSAGLPGAVLEQLRLSHADNGHVQIQGRAGWADSLSASAEVHARQFPWQYFAGMDEAPVQIDTAQLVVDYADDRYQGSVQGKLRGPAGEFAIDSRLKGDAERVRVEPLEVTAGTGHIRGVLDAAWQDAVSWAAELDVEHIDPGYWVADLPGQLDGHIRSEGRLAGEKLALTADVELSGRLREQPLKAELQATGQGEHWQLPVLDMRLGDNRIHGWAQLEQKLSGELKLDLAEPGQLQPGATGTLQGQVLLGGTLEQPDADIQLSGRNLAFDGQRVRSLKLAAQLEQGHSGKLNLLARGLASGEELLGQLQLKAAGSLAKHQLEASLTGPLADARLRLSGNLQAEQLHWQGQLEHLQLAIENQDWQLERAMDVDYLHEQHARLGAHCLVSAHGRLCADGRQQVLPQLQLDYRLQQFVLASLQPWLPDGLGIDGRLDGQLQVREDKAGLHGKVGLDAGQGALLLEQEGQRFAWRTLQLEADLQPAAVDARIELQGAEQGRLLIQSRIDPRPEDKPLRGRFDLRELDLHVLHGFLPDIEHLQGRITGQGELAGTLLQPAIQGEILLADAHVGGGMLPVTLEQLGLTVRIDGQQARLQGGWRSGNKGTASLTGDLDWAGELNAAIHLKGQDLPVFVQPYADLEVAPDLHIAYDPAGLAVTGSVAVPRGSITVPELPPDSVSVSSDTVVVGREPQEPDLDVHMNIAIDVGSERLKFSGFGLTSDVQGNLLVADNLSGRGVLELKNGRFRGYGQKLDLRRARLVFSGPLTQPYIDIEAVRVTGNVTAGLRISGLAEQPAAEVFSEPPMADEQAMSWLLLGKPLGGGEDGKMMAEAAIGLGLMGALPVTQKLADSLGIEDFQLESEGSGDQTSVVASGQITERLSLRYGVGIFEPGTTLGLRYKLTRRLYLDAASGLANSLDLFYRRSF